MSKFHWTLSEIRVRASLRQVRGLCLVGSGPVYVRVVEYGTARAHRPFSLRQLTVLTLCVTLESTTGFSSSTSHQSPRFQLACSHDSPLLSSITTSLFHCGLKTFLFCKSFTPQPFSSYSPSCFSGLTPRTPRTVYRYFWAYVFSVSFFSSWFRAVDLRYDTIRDAILTCARKPT